MIQLTRSHLYALLAFLPFVPAVGVGLIWLFGGSAPLVMLEVGIAIGAAMGPALLITGNWSELQDDWTPYERAMDGQISWTEAIERGEKDEVSEEGWSRVDINRELGDIASSLNRLRFTAVRYRGHMKQHTNSESILTEYTLPDRITSIRNDIRDLQSEI